MAISEQEQIRRYWQLIDLTCQAARCIAMTGSHQRWVAEHSSGSRDLLVRVGEQRYREDAHAIKELNRALKLVRSIREHDRIPQIPWAIQYAEIVHTALTAVMAANERG